MTQDTVKQTEQSVESKQDTKQMNSHISAGIKHYKEFVLNWLDVRNIPSDSTKMYIIEGDQYSIVNSQDDIDAAQKKGVNFRIGHLVVLVRELFSKEQGIVSAMQMLEFLNASEKSVENDNYLDAFISYSSALEKMEYLVKADFNRNNQSA
ncbi:hypothetical protein [Marinicellulosiphila megalodicopiae]|uniref:hypothetical protein n=1 Tax=Marinicellulosiphila megalodicopiae TaxID=2724896 RepID=UPI003BAEE874